MQNMQIHQFRHFLCHLARRQPGLMDLLDPENRLLAAEDLDSWAANLPRARLVEICRDWIQETLRVLQDSDPEAHHLFACVAHLQGEWDIEDAAALSAHDATATPAAPPPPLLALIPPRIETLRRLGLLIGGRGALRFIVPFPVAFCLEGAPLGGAPEEQALRRRAIMHFSSLLARQPDEDFPARYSWRMTNLLQAFAWSVALLEDQCGEPVEEIPRSEIPPPPPEELARALAEFGAALGPAVARRRSDQSWRLLLGAAIGARALSRHDIEADMLRLLGHHFRQMNQGAEAIEYLERARRLYLREPNPRMACLTACALALTWRDADSPENALREFENAWTLACEHRLDGEKLAIANCAGAICLKEEQPTAARRWFLRGWHAAGEGKSTETAGELGEVETSFFSSASSISSAAAEAAAPGLGDLAELANHIGMALRSENRLDEALRWFSEGLRLSRLERSRIAEAAACAEIAAVWEARGDFDGAINWLEEALGVRRDLSDWPGQAALLCRLARCARLSRRMSDAQRYAAQARGLARRHGLAALSGEVHIELAEQALDAGNDSAATQAFLEALERLHPSAPAHQLATIHHRLALVLYRRQALSDAAFHFLAAQGLARHAGLASLLKELTPWLDALAVELGQEAFDQLVERVTELWESGGLGGQPRSALRPFPTP